VARSTRGPAITIFSIGKLIRWRHPSLERGGRDRLAWVHFLRLALSFFARLSTPTTLVVQLASPIQHIDNLRDLAGREPKPINLEQVVIHRCAKLCSVLIILLAPISTKAETLTFKSQVQGEESRILSTMSFRSE
jgi:hypothetical protein